MAQIHSSHCSNAIVCQGRNPSFCITRNERVFALIETEISRSRPSTSKATSRHTKAASVARPRPHSVPGQPPADLHLVGQHAMVRQTAEAEQLTGLSRGNGVQPGSAFLRCALGLPEDHVTLSAGQWAAADRFGDLRIGVDLSERRSVSRLPCPQDQPSRLDPGRDVWRHGAVSVSNDASGRQANRTGAYGEVPMPAETCSHGASGPPEAG